MATGQDLIKAARDLLGAQYRTWYSGALIPMWLADGQGDPPSADYLLNGPGVMCSDLLNWCMEQCGLSAIGGTEAWHDYLYDSSEWFDVNSPAEVGAVAIQNYQSEANQGHIALYTGEHQLIQAITTAGVTEAYTDYQTYLWPECNFDIYARIPGVDYSGNVQPTPPAAPDWQTYGWYEAHADWSLTWNPPAS